MRGQPAIVLAASAYALGVGLGLGLRAPVSGPALLLGPGVAVAGAVSLGGPGGAVVAAGFAAAAGQWAAWHSARTAPLPRRCPRGAGDSEATARVLEGFALLRPVARSRPIRVERPAGCEGIMPAFGLPDTIPPGQRVRLHGRLTTDWRGEPAFAVDSVGPAHGRGGPRHRVAAQAARWRAGLEQRIERAVGARAGLALGLLAARRDGIDRATRRDFARSGTAHILAISGFHVGVWAGLWALMFAQLGLTPSVRWGAAALITWAYVLLVGAPSSAVRASALLTVWAGSRALGRPVHRLGALAAVALCALVVDPGALRGIGFQLSFAAATALAAWPSRAVAATPASGPGRIWSGMGNAVQASVLATAGTLPILAWHFGEVSLVSIPASVTVLPVASVAIVASLLAVAGSSVAPVLAPWLAWGADLPLTLLGSLVRIWARPEGAVVPVSRPGALWLGAATACGWILLRWGAGGGPVRGTRWVAATSAALACFIVAPSGWTGPPRGALVIDFIDVGQGDATLITTPRGRRILVDMGPPGWRDRPPGVLEFLGREGVRALDLAVLTHADADHVGGLEPTLENLDVGRIVGPGRARASGPFAASLAAARRREVPWAAATRGDRWTVDGVQFQVLGPPPGTVGDANEGSLLLLVDWQGFELLITGDAPTRQERAILRDLPRSLDVLQVGHHGSRTSTDPSLLRWARPSWAIVSVGRDNRYGHPDPAVVARLCAAGSRVARTDESGSLRLQVTEQRELRITDGEGRGLPPSGACVGGVSARSAGTDAAQESAPNLRQTR